MAKEQLKTLTEPMYYILLSLTREQHGYGIMQNITEITEGRVTVGPGTLYALLGRFEYEEIIVQVREADRRKVYRLTDRGGEMLSQEYKRLRLMVKDGAPHFDGDDLMMNGPFQGESCPIGIISESEALNSVLDDTLASPEKVNGNAKEPKDKQAKPKREGKKKKEWFKPGLSYITEKVIKI